MYIIRHCEKADDVVRMSHLRYLMLLMMVIVEVWSVPPPLQPAKKLCFHHLLGENQDINVYNFTMINITGDSVPLEQYRGKPLLIVNVATYCYYSSQYHQLNQLKEEFPQLEILAFPCNQFGLFEPGRSSEQILNGIMYVRPGGGFQPTFPIMARINVNGEKEEPLYTYLKSYCLPPHEQFMNPLRLHYSPLRADDIRWNYEKFLVNPDGRPYMRYSTLVDPVEMRDDINLLIQHYYNADE